MILKQPELHTPLKNYIALFGETQLKETPEKKQKQTNEEKELHKQTVQKTD